MKKINLGCGVNIKEGYINLDIKNNEGVDIKHDLNVFPYPFNDNEFDEVYCSHILEHVEDFYKTLWEIIRISKPNSLLHIRVPHFANGRAFATFDHKRFFAMETFDELSYGTYNITFPIKIISRKYNFTDPSRNPRLNKMMSWINLFPHRIYERFFCWYLPVNEIELIIKNIKGTKK